MKEAMDSAGRMFVEARKNVNTYNGVLRCTLSLQVCANSRGMGEDPTRVLRFRIRKQSV
jgi:hypothetical protein